MVAYGGIVVFFTILLTIIGKRHGGRFENQPKTLDIKDGENNLQTIVSEKDIDVISSNEMDFPPNYKDPIQFQKEIMGLRKIPWEQLRSTKPNHYPVQKCLKVWR
jgi:hypothetical protein